jgi:hypothetical protein
MTDTKGNPFRYATEIESVRLTNAFIRLSWKATAIITTIIARLTAAIVLATLRARERNRRLP